MVFVEKEIEEIERERKLFPAVKLVQPHPPAKKGASPASPSVQLLDGNASPTEEDISTGISEPGQTGPTPPPPGPKRRDRSGQPQEYRADSVAMQTFVSEALRDDFNKLADLTTDRSTAKLLGTLIKHAVRLGFVPPVNNPADTNKFAVQAFVDKKTHRDAKELVRLHRISTAELLRRLIEHAVEQDFIPAIAASLEKTRADARTRILSSMSQSSARSFKPRPK
jgi:hypothetical protein